MACSYWSSCAGPAHTQPPLDLGIAMDGAWYTGGMPDSTVNVQLEWRSTIEALQQYKRIRNGGSAQFVFQCIGEVCHIGGGKNGSWPRYRSEPEAIRGDIYITYPKETWVAMLNQLGARNNVLVEFPFARVPQRRGTAFGRHCKTRGTTSTRVAQLDGRDAYGRSGMRSNSGGTSRLSSTALGGRRRRCLTGTAGARKNAWAISVAIASVRPSGTTQPRLGLDQGRRTSGPRDAHRNARRPRSIDARIPARNTRGNKTA